MTHDTQSTTATVTPTEDLSKKHVKLKFEAKVRCLSEIINDIILIIGVIASTPESAIEQQLLLIGKLLLTHFKPTHFLMFSRGIERKHRP